MFGKTAFQCEQGSSSSHFEPKSLRSTDHVLSIISFFYFFIEYSHTLGLPVQTCSIREPTVYHLFTVCFFPLPLDPCHGVPLHLQSLLSSHSSPPLLYSIVFFSQNLFSTLIFKIFIFFNFPLVFFLINPLFDLVHASSCVLCLDKLLEPL